MSRASERLWEQKLLSRKKLMINLGIVLQQVKQASSQIQWCTWVSVQGLIGWVSYHASVEGYNLFISVSRRQRCQATVTSIDYTVGSDTSCDPSEDNPTSYCNGPLRHTQHMRKKNFIMSWFSLSLTVPCYHAYVIKFGVSQTAGNNYDVGESFLENSHLYMSLYLSCFLTSALKRASFDTFTKIG